MYWLLLRKHKYGLRTGALVGGTLLFLVIQGLLGYQLYVLLELLYAAAAVGLWVWYTVLVRNWVRKVGSQGLRVFLGINTFLAILCSIAMGILGGVYVIWQHWEEIWVIAVSCSAFILGMVTSYLLLVVGFRDIVTERGYYD